MLTILFLFLILHMSGATIEIRLPHRPYQLHQCRSHRSSVCVNLRLIRGASRDRIIITRQILCWAVKRAPSA